MRKSILPIVFGVASLVGCADSERVNYSGRYEVNKSMEIYFRENMDLRITEIKKGAEEEWEFYRAIGKDRNPREFDILEVTSEDTGWRTWSIKRESPKSQWSKEIIGKVEKLIESVCDEIDLRRNR